MATALRNLFDEEFPDLAREQVKLLVIENLEIFWPFDCRQDLGARHGQILRAELALCEADYKLFWAKLVEQGAKHILHDSTVAVIIRFTWSIDT